MAPGGSEQAVRDTSIRTPVVRFMSDGVPMLLLQVIWAVVRALVSKKGNFHVGGSIRLWANAPTLAGALQASNSIPLRRSPTYDRSIGSRNARNQGGTNYWQGQVRAHQAGLSVAITEEEWIRSRLYWCGPSCR